MMKKIDKLEPDVEIGHKKTVSTYQKDLKLKELIEWQREMVDFHEQDLLIAAVHLKNTRAQAEWRKETTARVEALESLVSGLNSSKQDEPAYCDICGDPAQYLVAGSRHLCQAHWEEPFKSQSDTKQPNPHSTDEKEITNAMSEGLKSMKYHVNKDFPSDWFKCDNGAFHERPCCCTCRYHSPQERHYEYEAIDHLNRNYTEQDQTTCSQCLDENLKGIHTKELGCRYYSKKWQPITRQAVYYFTGDGRVEWAHYHPSESLFANLERLGNFFKTKEEAEIARDKIQKLLGEL